MLIALDRRLPAPLYRQIYLAIRAMILDGRLAPGARLPSSRVLAADLDVARTTVLGAYDQLAAEGFIAGRRGGGTRVAREIARLRSTDSGGRTSGRTSGRNERRTPARPSDSKPHRPLVSALGARLLSAGPSPGLPHTFAALAAGIPALDAFPFTTWRRLSNRRWRTSPATLFLPDDGPGFRPLREAISDYVVTARGVRCTPEQIVITAGAQQAIDLAARLLLDPGNHVWMEEPGYLPARASFTNAGARIVSVPLDDQGLDVAAGRALAPHARLAFVTPSFQAPLGMTMSLARRLALLDWAAEHDAWVIEDDYNGEFRYDGHPTAAMQGLEHPGSRRILFLGTFSKTLFPALRLGYAILPPELVDAFTLARMLVDRHSPVAEQAVLADFIGEGHFARHMRRMRALYAERQHDLVTIAGREVGDAMRVPPAAAGMRLIGWLPPGTSDQHVAREAARHGVQVVPLSPLRVVPSSEQALLLGYAPFTRPQMRRALRVIGDAISEVQQSRIRGAT